MKMRGAYNDFLRNGQIKWQFYCEISEKKNSFLTLPNPFLELAIPETAHFGQQKNLLM